MAINRGMNKEGVVHIHSGILLSHKKEQNNAIYSEMDREIVKLSEVSQTEKELSCDIAYIWNLK